MQLPRQAARQSLHSRRAPVGLRYHAYPPRSPFSTGQTLSPPDAERRESRSRSMKTRGPLAVPFPL